VSTKPAKPNRIALAQAINPVSLLVPPAIVTTVLWLTSVNPVTLTAGLSAHVMLQIVWSSYLFWDKGKRGGLPVLSMVGAVYWTYFALALFWGERTLFLSRLVPVSEDAVTQTMMMAVLAVGCLLVGMEMPLPITTVTRAPDIDSNSTSSWVYLRIILVAGTVAGFFPSVNFLLGANGRAIMIILVSTVPVVAFAILLQRFWRGNASPIEGPLLLTTGVARVAGSLASGWLGPVVDLGLTIVALYIVVHRRIPWAGILLTIASVLFLQAGKAAFRDTFWQTGMQGADSTNSNTLDRAQFWLNSSASQWSDALQTGGSGDSRHLTSKTLQRASLLTQVAHVLELTPSQIPFQEGQTYSYLAIGLIPRFLWPDKPSINEANQFYQLAYGLSDTKTVTSTSISVGAMAEAYINFGWLGVIVIMCVIGILLQIYERFLVLDQRHVLLLSIGVALLPQFLLIESQLGVYLGGLLQHIFLPFLVFLPITRRPAGVAVMPRRLQPAAVRVRG
jgi:O-antigen polysaccharide polymerase Wzy